MSTSLGPGALRLPCPPGDSIPCQPPHGILLKIPGLRRAAPRFVPLLNVNQNEIFVCVSGVINCYRGLHYSWAETNCQWLGGSYVCDHGSTGE
jgi:hypothetical protein